MSILRGLIAKIVINNRIFACKAIHISWAPLPLAGWQERGVCWWRNGELAGSVHWGVHGSLGGRCSSWKSGFGGEGGDGWNGARMCQNFVSWIWVNFDVWQFGFRAEVEKSVRCTYTAVPPTLAEEFIKFYMTLIWKRPFCSILDPVWLQKCHQTRCRSFDPWRLVRDGMASPTKDSMSRKSHCYVQGGSTTLGVIFLSGSGTVSGAWLSIFQECHSRRT